MDSNDSLGSPNSTSRLPHFETLSKLDIDNYKSGSRSSFSDSEESYSNKYNSERVAKLKQMGKTEMNEYREFYQKIENIIVNIAKITS